MATRLYMPGASDTAPTVSPAFDAVWDVTASAIRRWAEPGKISDNALAQKQIATTGNTPAGASDVLMAQFVSAPLDVNQTITGNVKGQINGGESNTLADMRAQIVIWVYTGAGSRGTLYAGDAAALANEFGTTVANRKYPRGGSTALGSVNALAGDRIVIEVGFRKHENAVTSRTGTMDFGNPVGATDLPEDETDTTRTKAPWVEFSQTITFTAAVLRESQVVAEVLSTTVGALRVSQLVVEVLSPRSGRDINITEVIFID